MKSEELNFKQDTLNPSFDILKAKAIELSGIPEDNLSLPR